jgi:enoyl-CoA hydratase
LATVLFALVTVGLHDHNSVSEGASTATLAGGFTRMLPPDGEIYRCPVTDSAADQVLIRVENYLGHITLNRPRQINALTLEMINAVRAALTAWVDDPRVAVVLIDGAGDRGLCAGGDIRLLFDGLVGIAPAPAKFWTDEYRMNLALARYPKPIVSYMTGITLGGGVGISAHCRVRIVTENSQVGMPETAIGLCPDVGGLYLLSRSPGELGTHAALTGARFGPADAIAAGLADHFVPAAGLPRLTEQLRGGTVPHHLGEPAPAGDLALQRAWIDDCYAGDDVAAIMTALRASPESAARQAAQRLAVMSPTALKVTLSAIRRAATLSLDGVLGQDFRVGSRFLLHPDLQEGIRALIIDKDRNPRWQPASLAEVTDADVATFFEPLAESMDPW